MQRLDIRKLADAPLITPSEELANCTHVSQPDGGGKEFEEAAGLQQNLRTKVPDDLRTGMAEAQLAVIEERQTIKHTLGNLTMLTPPANIEAQNLI